MSKGILALSAALFICASTQIALAGIRYGGRGVGEAVWRWVNSLSEMRRSHEA
jgi:hypothetical protein